MNVYCKKTLELIEGINFIEGNEYTLNLDYIEDKLGIYTIDKLNDVHFIVLFERKDGAEWFVNHFEKFI